MAKQKHDKNSQGETDPIRKQDLPGNPDAKIDQDFPGYPNAQGNEKIINPKTSNEKKVADTDKKDGEKINYKASEDELEDNGSGSAFERTENPSD
jgi:hypothetical protein